MKIKMRIVAVGFIFLLGTLTLAESGTIISDGGEGRYVESTVVSQNFLQPNTKENGEYIVIDMGTNMATLMNEGMPILPYTTEILTFPIGTRIKDVTVKTSEVKTVQLNKKITVSPQQLPLSNKNMEPITMNTAAYASAEVYPDKWYGYRTGGGLDESGNHITLLTIHFYPVRYQPALNTLYYVENIEIKLIYEQPSHHLISHGEYDLVIIAPSGFSSALQPLIEHKNNHGVETKLVTLEDIYENYDGRDQAEKIKYFIKGSIEEWGIEYVMLVGSHEKLPVRYSQLEDNRPPYYEAQFISELYYADIYNSEGDFDDWDPNGNGVFAEWPMEWKKEEIDLYPDVYVGRLACRNAVEVTLMVNKIIAYEENTYGEPWFKTMVLVGGDTFNDSQYGDNTNYYEGEEANAKAIDIMEGFNPIKVWASNRDTGKLVPIPKDIIMAINSGCGFAYFCGHGSPQRWNTYWPEEFEDARARGLWLRHMPFLSNGNKAPVLMIGGCHNSQFNTSYECWGWHFVRKIGGGAIASIGCTGYGVDGVGDFDNDGIPDCTQYYDGWFETTFFENYKGGIDILGETFGQTVTGYITTFIAGGESWWPRYNYKEVESRVLLGDPSLKIGGYP